MPCILEPITAKRVPVWNVIAINLSSCQSVCDAGVVLLHMNCLDEGFNKQIISAHHSVIVRRLRRGSVDEIPDLRSWVRHSIPIRHTSFFCGKNPLTFVRSDQLSLHPYRVDTILDYTSLVSMPLYLVFPTLLHHLNGMRWHWALILEMTSFLGSHAVLASL